MFGFHSSSPFPDKMTVLPSVITIDAHSVIVVTTFHKEEPLVHPLQPLFQQPNCSQSGREGCNWQQFTNAPAGLQQHCALYCSNLPIINFSIDINTITFISWNESCPLTGRLEGRLSRLFARRVVLSTTGSIRSVRAQSQKIILTRHLGRIAFGRYCKLNVLLVVKLKNERIETRGRRDRENEREWKEGGGWPFKFPHRISYYHNNANSLQQH